ncbi:acetyltransferase [Desulfonema magnum]|uniref:Sugar O-acyltransferase, sialic acid O-acetyltransferase NeuD family n=1 Tax=Desulfonema magnum TaxID=45655 RepID=A0A975BXF6_9BACT|nr:acetyltransferase [Desulfonema magnum]QTA93591.1 Sugar O-acyltransferase, sialic acid O-acetyltransferase NeuD family [Desulfonema magnum]
MTENIQKKEKLIAIYGASGFGRELAWLIESCAKRGMNYNIICFIDDDEKKHGTHLNNIPVLSLKDAKKRYPQATVVGGIGNPKIREKLMNKAADQGFVFETIIHPDTESSQWLEISEGSVICAGNTLTTNITLGHHVQINLDCTIGHDVIMGDYTTLAPGVHISGWVHFGKRVYVGTGAVIINGTEEAPLTIGDDAVIGAGACVTKSVPPLETWGGVPAKPLKKR